MKVDAGRCVPLRFPAMPLTHKQAAANGGRKRWKGSKKRERSEEMRRVAKLRWQRPKRAKAVSSPGIRP